MERTQKKTAEQSEFDRALAYNEDRLQSADAKRLIGAFAEKIRHLFDPTAILAAFMEYRELSNGAFLTDRDEIQLIGSMGELKHYRERVLKNEHTPIPN